MDKNKKPIDKNAESTYNPFEHRNLKSPTTNIEATIHLVKGSLGSGILTMPYAFKSTGLWCGMIATILVGIIVTYGNHILVKCAHILCFRTKTPSLGYSDVAEIACLTGPESLKKWSNLAHRITKTFLVIQMIGVCCVYNVFVAKNLQQLVDYYSSETIHIRWFILMLLLPLILINLVRTLKFLAPFSMIANILVACGVFITMYYFLVNIPAVDKRTAFESPLQYPKYFSIAIFALEAVGVIMALENNMENPKRFIGCPSVLNIGMGYVTVLYTIFGFLGYLKYGDEINSSVTINLPVDEALAQSVKIMITVAVFLTYSIQFYVPMDIIWTHIQDKFRRKHLAEYLARIALITLTVLLAVAVPDLGPFISLLGSVCLSMLGLIFPALIEIIVYLDDFGKFKWRLVKNILLIVFGIIGFIAGAYYAILDIIDLYI